MINIEFRTKENAYPKFLEFIKNKNVAIIGDVNTQKYLYEIKDIINEYAKNVVFHIFPDEELIPNEAAISEINKICENANYLLDYSTKHSYFLSI